MTRWSARDDALMHLARLGASVEHNRQRSNSQSEDGRDRNSCRPEHISILPHCDVRLLGGDQPGDRAGPPAAGRFNPITAPPVGVALVHFPGDLRSGCRVAGHQCQLLRLRGLNIDLPRDRRHSIAALLLFGAAGRAVDRHDRDTSGTSSSTNVVATVPSVGTRIVYVSVAPTLDSRGRMVI